jgi:hypothetical protein
MTQSRCLGPAVAVALIAVGKAPVAFPTLLTP